MSAYGSWGPKTILVLEHDPVNNSTERYATLYNSAIAGQIHQSDSAWLPPTGLRWGGGKGCDNVFATLSCFRGFFKLYL